MTAGAPGRFGARLKALREAAGFTQEELATIAGLSVHAVSALERGLRRRPHVETVRALSLALELTAAARDALLGDARERPAEAPAPSSWASLPLSPTALLGRDGDLRVLRSWLDAPSARLVTLTGPGGVGKTRLALEVARAIDAEGAVRAAFVPLAAIRTPEFVAPAIAEAFGLSDTASLGLSARVRVACGDRPALALLDNFEQVLEAAPIVAELMAAVPSLRLIVTSRAPLHLRGEREYLVEPLALVAGGDASPDEDVAQSPAVRLFVARAQDVRPDFRLTPETVGAVAEICRRLDALPLAIELAAPWVKVLAPEALLHRLDDGVFLHVAVPRDLPERQQTMHGAVAWSYQLLGPDERTLFRRLAVLPGQFTVEAAAAVLAGPRESEPVTADALRRIAGLMDKSLLRRAEGHGAKRPLFAMLETVRAYASIELAASGERDEALEGLARHCGRDAALIATGLVGPAQAAALDQVREDLDTYRAALAWLLERGRAADVVTIAWSLQFFWIIRGHGSEGLRWYEQGLALAAIPAESEARALLGSGMIWYTRGELDRARAGLERAETLARGTGEDEILVQVENMLGHVEHAVGRMEAARDRFARSVEGFRRLSVAWGTGHALSGQAWVALATRDLIGAERLLDEAEPLLHEAGPWFLSLSAYLRAVLAVRRGQAGEAIAIVGRSLARIRELNDRFAYVYALVPLAAAAALEGEAAWTARILGARDAVTDATGATVVDASVHDLVERAEREARDRLGAAGWSEAYGAGRKVSIDTLLAEIQGREERSEGRKARGSEGA